MTNVMERISEDSLRRVAERASGTSPVLSLYLDMDPTTLPTQQDRLTQLESLIDSVEEEMKTLQLGHEDQEQLRASIAKVREFFEEASFSPEGAGGIALFTGPPELFMVLRLPRSVDTGFRIGERPALEPLAELLEPDRWCVLLVNRRAARLFTGSGDVLRQVGDVEDQVHRQHQAGGWSQSRFERSVEQDVANHLEHVAQELDTEHRRRPIDRLVIGTTEETYGSVLDALSAELRDRVVGRIDIDVEHSSLEEVREKLIPLVDETRAREEEDAVERLAQARGKDGSYGLGLEQTLRALNERKVEVLLIAEGYEASGVTCPSCGWLFERGAACPNDGSALQLEEDLVGAAISAAVMQSARVLTMRTQPLPDGEGIAGLMRY